MKQCTNCCFHAREIRSKLVGFFCCLCDLDVGGKPDPNLFKDPYSVIKLSLDANEVLVVEKALAFRVADGENAADFSTAGALLKRIKELIGNSGR